MKASLFALMLTSGGGPLTRPQAELPSAIIDVAVDCGEGRTDDTVKCANAALMQGRPAVIHMDGVLMVVHWTVVGRCK